jgi:hypothetical protein
MNWKSQVVRIRSIVAIVSVSLAIALPAHALLITDHALVSVFADAIPNRNPQQTNLEFTGSLSASGSYTHSNGASGTGSARVASGALGASASAEGVRFSKGFGYGTATWHDVAFIPITQPTIVKFIYDIDVQGIFSAEDLPLVGLAGLATTSLNIGSSLKGADLNFHSAGGGIQICSNSLLTSQCGGGGVLVNPNATVHSGVGGGSFSLTTSAEFEILADPLVGPYGGGSVE